MKSIENESLIGFTVSIEENYLKLELSESFEQLLVATSGDGGCLAGYKPSVQVSPLPVTIPSLSSQFILFLFFL